MQIKELIKDYFAILKKEDINALFTILADDALLSTPFDGIIRGHESIKDYVVNQRDWLLSKNAKLDILNIIGSEHRLVFEFNLTFPSDNKKVSLPFAVALDISDKLVHSIRMYYTMIPIEGAHYGIKPLLPVDNSIEMPEIISRFLDALNHADIPLLVSLFEKNAVVQEPDGTDSIHRGELMLQTFFSSICKNNGTLLKPCSITYGERFIALEYLFDKWRGSSFDQQAGIFIFDITSYEKIASLRIYNDVS